MWLIRAMSPKKGYSILCLVLSAFTINCAAFASTPVVKDTIGDGERVDTLGSLELIGFDSYPRLKESLQTRFRLEKGRHQEAISEEAKLALKDTRSTHLFLLEKPKKHPILRIVNLVSTILTGLLIPFYNEVENTLELRYYSAGKLMNKCSYDLRTNEFIGLLALPFSPFYWSSTEQEKLIQNSTEELISTCLNRMQRER